MRSPAPLDTIVYEGPLCTVGRFECRADDPRFSDTGPIGGHLFVFPRSAVTIAHAGCDPEVADRNVVMLYNAGQRYRRGKLSDDGDVCDWFAVGSSVAAAAVAPWEPRVRDRPERPFRFRRGPGAAELYLRQRQLVTRLAAVEPGDDLDVEEHVLALLRDVVGAAYRARGAHPVAAGTSARRRHRWR